MKRVLYLLWCVALLAGCGKDKSIDEPDEPNEPEKPKIVTLELSDADLIFEAAGGQKTFTITCNADWTITNGSDWCTTDVTSGNGNRTVTVTTQAYGELEDRNMNLTVKAGDKAVVLTVTQKYADAVIPDKAKFEVAQGGGDLAIRVRSSVTYTVTIPDTCQSWIQPAPETRAVVSDTTYRFVISENEGDESRTGFIIFSTASLSDTVHIFQAQKDRLVLTRTKYSLFKEDTTITVELKTNVDYEVSIADDAASWISRVETRACRVDRLQFHIEENTGNTFREGEIVFKDKNGDFADTVHVTQYAKDTYRGNIVFQTEQDLIDFRETGNTVIVGNVSVEGKEIKNLQELGNLLVVIDGNLTLACSALESLEGLGGLKRITRGLIVQAGSMTTFAGLENLESIGGDFTVSAYSSNSSSSLNSLESFSGLSSLKSIGGSFWVSASSSLNSLESFAGLENLESIGGNFTVSASSSLNSLESFAGLENLESIGGNFTVSAPSFSLNSLESFSGLSSLKSIGGDFTVSVSYFNSLNSLKSFAGLEHLKSIGGNFTVSASSSSSSSSSSFSSLNSLKSFAGLENLESIGGNFTVSVSPPSIFSYYSSSYSLNSLESFSGLSSLKSIGGDFTVSASSPPSSSSSSSSLNSLKSFAGLENLESIGGNFTVSASSFYYSPSSPSSSSSLNRLESFSGLSSLKSIGGDFTVSASSSYYSSSLNSLGSFNGLDNLENIGGNFKLTSSSDNSSSLASFKFTGLSKLESIGGDFEVNSSASNTLSNKSSYSLNSLEFFESLVNLERIGGDFKVNSKCSGSSSYSLALKSFLGLEKLNSVQNIYVTGCSALYDFCALKNAVRISNCGFKTEGNGYNPTKDILLNGNCSANK